MTGLPRAATYLSVQPARVRTAPERSRLVAAWLFAVAVCVIAMVVVGGATRLTGSGLSITQWKPLAGALPPLDSAAWDDLFRRYRAIPQYQALNAGMTLAAFKSIFWWEWGHRLLGRVLGVVFAVPFFAFLGTRRLPKRLVWPCAGLFVLGGLQGLVGWWMVASGLETRLYVAPERLAAHLGLALILFCALIWTALDAGWGGRQTAARSGWSAAHAFLGLVYLQCLLGALVAGNHAGLANADWPLMSGRVFPSDYWQGEVWTTIVHGLAAVQLHHRLLAYGLAIFALGLAIRGARSSSKPVRTLSTMIAGIVVVQIGLGVSLLLGGVPLGLALSHQITASLLLGCATALAWLAGRSAEVL